jgi:signal transduction histidine kinase
LNGIATQQSHNFLDKILESASRMNTMIDGVLTYSTMNAADLKIEMVDLNALIVSIENDLEVLIQQKQAAIVYEDLPSVEGTQVLLYQLFYNLINNSLKFCKDTEGPQITLSALVTEIAGIDYSLISVSDNGIGFDAEFNEKIFNTFTRLNPKTRYDGTGLGLSLCKKIVERHHGWIVAQGREGVGATFKIALPFRQKDFFFKRSEDWQC